jgi:predicted amino acid dehydrogenase
MNVGDVFGLIALMVGIVGIAAIVGSVIKRLISLQERKIEVLAGQTAEKAAQYASHNRELEERLRVVERIVSDKGYDIALQIDALRDVRAVEETGTR